VPIRRALTGHDGRESGPGLEAALASGLASQGARVVSAGLMTTPGLAVLARELGFDLAAMVSASHNPAEDNGIKLFGGSAQKLSEEVEARIEAELLEPGEPAPAAAAPAVDTELCRRYVELLLERAGRDLDLSRMAIVLDCANGGASRVGPALLERTGARVIAIHAQPDGSNINRDCGATRPGSLRQRVQAEDADLGIALDGDGDRCILVDERGELVDGDGILTLCAEDAVARDLWPDRRVVATVMSNQGLHRALESLGVGLVSVDVGDRNVVEALRRERLPLGAEQSGHVVFGADHGYIGDGLYTALRVLRIRAAAGRALSALAARFQAFPQVLLDVPVAIKPDWSELVGVRELVRSIEEELGADGRVHLRYSGTEPLARVMIEGPERGRIERHARALAEEIRKAIGS
jgi:phosphoglucosamine mutase